MDFLLFLIGTDEPLEGRWERQDNAFAGCVIQIEKNGTDFTGRIVSLPQAMAEADWQIGEPKWQDIRPTGQSCWLIRDSMDVQKNGFTFTRCAGRSLGNAYSASEPMRNSPPGIRTMPLGGLDARLQAARERTTPRKNEAACFFNNLAY
jgi:hypothetical protein